PKELKHPQSSKLYFSRFCLEHGFQSSIIEEVDDMVVNRGEVYIAIKQQDVVKVIKQSRMQGFKCGADIGVLAYNDIPSYEVIDEGITALSIDWEMMGNEAAEFVLNNISVRKELSTNVRLRSSL
ncbi:MAG: substrate-binding domain-containing protein, partial [Bacteroides sp.]